MYTEYDNDDLINLDDPGEVAEWVKAHGKKNLGDSVVSFPFSEDETRLLEKIVRRIYWGAKTAVQDLHDLRILYWQVVGWKRG